MRDTPPKTTPRRTRRKNPLPAGAIDRTTAGLVAGLTTKDMQNWIAVGHIREPIFLPQLVGLSVVRWLQGKGLGVRTALKIVSVFDALPEAELLAHFAAGRVCLVADLDAGESKLVSAGWMLSAASGKTPNVLVLDLQAAYHRVKAKLDVVIKARCAHGN